MMRITINRLRLYTDCSWYVEMKLLVIYLCLLAYIFPSLCFLPNSFTRKLSSSLLNAINERQLITTADCLFVFPVLAIPAEEFGHLRKLLPEEIREATIPRNTFITYIDNTGFSQIADYLSGNSFCIFSRSEEETEALTEPFLTWIRRLTPSSSYNPQKTGFLICKRTHMMKLDVTNNKAENDD